MMVRRETARPHPVASRQATAARVGSTREAVVANGTETLRILTSWPLRRGLALTWTAVALALCLAPSHWLPRSESHHIIPHLDKLIHATLFAGFGLLWMWAGASPRRWVGVLITGALLAITTEVLQDLPIVHRDPDLFDGLADLVGTALGIGMSWLGLFLSFPNARR
jgi:VanZ family protein